jgi:8-oxo-dGTP pyrophosphatase MutT (NUDIX family)
MGSRWEADGKMDGVDERPIRQAASAICVRDGRPGEPEVLVVERSAGSRFLPGYIAFPGGAVEAGDEDRAARWFGEAAEAHRAAAVRELIEEVGLAATSVGLVPAGGLARVDDDPPDPGTVREICRWIAPPDTPVRFDARYFAVPAGDASEPVVDGREVVRAWWISPLALLRGWNEGAHKLYWPTWFTVGELAACASGDDVLSLRFETREPTQHEQTTMPRHVIEQIT